MSLTHRYVCKAKLCNRCEAHSQLHYRCEVRSHYMKCVTWVTTIRFTVMLCVWLTHIYEYDANSWVTTVRLTHNFTTSVRLTHTWITTVRQLPTDMMLTFTLRVWDSQLHNRLRDTHTHIHNWVTTMTFTHNYATGVRLTITQWSKAHSHSYLSYHHEAHSQ